MIFANHLPDQMLHIGNSQVINAQGEILAKSVSAPDTVVVGDIRLASGKADPARDTGQCRASGTSPPGCRRITRCSVVSVATATDLWKPCSACAKTAGSGPMSASRSCFRKIRRCGSSAIRSSARSKTASAFPELG